jgi:hypothetical protein
MKKIVLVGCGNIGSRHLQALTKLSGQVVVDIVENYSKSIILAKSRLEETKYNEKYFKFNWHKDFQTLDGNSDLVIIATLSESRVILIEKLLKIGYSRFLIEKLVCQSTAEYKHLLKIIKKFNAKGWVNTRCRYFKSYQKIKQIYKNSNKISLNMISGDTGLSTGAIHYIDLFSWILNSKEIKLNGDLLFDETYKNKRGKNFIEFGGTIIGSNKKKSVLTLSHFPGTPSLYVTINDGKHQIVIDEYNEKILYSDFKKFQFKLEHVSTLTTEIVNDIIKKDNCLLPTLNDSFNHHSEIFKIFSKQLGKIKNKKIKKCPIT